MNTKPIALFGPSTMPRESRPGPLLLHIQSSLQELVDRSR